MGTNAIRHIPVLIALLVIFGCAKSPVMPEISDPPPINPDVNQQEPIHNCAGWHMIAIDTRTMGIDVVPVRLTNMHFNVTGILNTSMGVSAAGVPSEHDPANGIFVFDVTLTHPFGTKPNLTGFDVKGILITEGTYAVGSWTVAGSDETRLLNPDGYSRWWNPSEFTEPGLFGYTVGNLSCNQSGVNAMINPYKVFADILDAESATSTLYSVPLDDQFGRCVFSAGASNTRRYRIKFPIGVSGPVIRYGYAVDACWAAPTIKPPVEIPDDFPIIANQPEPFYIETFVNANSMFYDSESGVSGGYLLLDFRVTDWQGIYLNDAPNEIASVNAYSPLFSGVLNPNATSGSGQWALFGYYLTGVAVPTKAGQEIVAIEFVSNGGPAWDQGLGYPAPSGDVASFSLVDIPIVDPPCEADGNNSVQSAVEIGCDESVVEYLCYGTDDVDYYRLFIPYGSQAENGNIRAYSDIHGFQVTVYDNEMNPIETDSGSSDLFLNLSGKLLTSGDYIIKVETTVASGFASTYFLDVGLTVQELPEPSPEEVSTGFLDMNAENILAFGYRAVFTGPNGLWIYDIFHPETPVPLLRLYDHVRGAPDNYNGFVYYISGDSEPNFIRVIDLTQPVPQDTGIKLDLGYEYDLLTMNDEYLFICYKENGYVGVYELSDNPGVDPPVPVASFFIQANPIKLDMYEPAGSNPTLLAMTNSGLYAYNVADVFNVVPKGSDTVINAINRDFDVRSPKIVMVVESSTNDFLRTYTLSQVDHTLLKTGSVNLPINPCSVAITSSYAQVAARDQDLITTVSIEDIYDPGVVETTSVAGRCSKLDMSFKLFALIPDRGFISFELESNGGPQLLNFVKCMNFPKHGHILNNIGYFIDDYYNYTALKTILLDDLVPTSVFSELPISDDPVDITGDVHALFIASSNPDSLHVYSLQVPSNPSPHSTVPLSYTPSSICLNNDYLYVSFENGNCIDIYDVATTTSINFIGSIPIVGPDKGLIVHGNVMYGIRDQHLSVYDLTDPENPVEQTGLAMPGSILSKLIARVNYLFVLCQDGIATVNLNDPLNPQLTDFLSEPTPALLSSFALDELYLYSGHGDSHPYATNVSDPSTPSGWLEFFPETPYFGGDYITYKRHLYEMDHGFGLRVFNLYP